MKIRKYLLYALGEVLLIIVGILIAVSINDKINRNKEDKIRCAYQYELLKVIEHDIKDTEENIQAFETWNPMILDLFKGLQSNNLKQIDSLNLKFGTVGNFIFLGQRSKSKIEEFKYSSVTLIKNRTLKNDILLYQNESIDFILQLEERYKLIGEDLREYYTRNFKGYNYEPAYPINLEKIENDNVYFSLVYQRLNMNYLLLKNYKELLQKQSNIRDKLMKEISTNCK